MPEPHTMYKNIHSLPAGSSLWLGRDGRKIESRYFDFRGEMQQLEEAGPEASQDELRAALMESVEHHLVSDVPVGVFLSAGLDSASIMALVAEVSGSQMESMTLRFDEFSGTASDEAPLAEEIAKAYNTRHQTRTVKGADFQADQAKLLAAMDQPSIDGVNTYFVAKEAADMGLKVALSGVGGDELLGGYDSFRQIPSLVGKLGWIPGLRPLGAGFRVLSGPVLKALTSPKYASLLEYSSDYGSAYLLRRGLFMPWELPEFMDADIVREGWQALNLLENMNASIAGIQRPRNKVSLLESLHYMRGQLLRDADWAGMAHSLEIRTPLVDATLFTKLAGRGYSKQAMAITPKFPMPSSILNRPKTGFAIPVRDWLQGDDGTQSDERGVRGWAKSVYATLK
ncbi:MAG: hypothetical protein HON14_11950 [Rhodospirillaceae bacterium]|nr:hypothetical protein [Rhodospirillaceae bacterium]